MSYEPEQNNEKKIEKLVCPKAPRITIKPEKKKIPYINVIENDDSFSSEEQNENPISNTIQKNIDKDDTYDDDSFDDSCDEETKSEMVKEELNKF